MFFSVLVPVYNVEKYIEECIRSVLNQSFTDYEILLIDDGSLDKSGEICDYYAQIDSRIRVFHKDNGGPLQSRQYAIEKAFGDYYIFLDSDDKLKINALQIIYETIKHYDCDCVIYGLERELDGKIISRICDNNEKYLIDKSEIYRHCLIGLENNAICRKAVKSTVFYGIDYAPYYYLRMGEDLLHCLEIYKNSKSIVLISDILYTYRVNPSSLTNKKEIVIDFTVREKVLEFLRNEAVFSTKDWKAYEQFCQQLFSNQLIRICKSKKTFKEKKEYFCAIDISDYYQMFLNKKCYKGLSIQNTVILFLFQKKMYKILNMIINIR